MRHLSDEEEKLLFEELKGKNLLKNIVVFAINTGMRRGQILNLKWFDADLKRNILYVRQTKMGKDRAIPINDKVRLMLEKRLK